MAKDPAFSFYAQDYLVDTFQWDRGSKSLHVDLLAISWINGFIEADVNGIPLNLSAEDVQLWHGRVKHKWELREGKLYNARLEDGREKRKKFLEGQSEKGKKSAEKRLKKSKKVTKKQPNSNHGSTVVEPPFNHLKTENEKEKEKEKEKEIENSFGKSENLLPESDPPITWQMWVDTWFDFFKAKHEGIPPKFDGAQGKALKTIQEHLTTVAAAKEQDIPPDRAGYQAWQYVLERWDRLDPWLKTQFDLTVISKKLNDIINRLKNATHNQHPSNSNQKPGTSEARIKAARDY